MMSVIEQKKSRKQSKRKGRNDIDSLEELVPKEFRERKHYFSELPLELQKALREGEREIEAGLGIPDEEVWKEIDKWLEENE
jgi:hypothetical protein